MKTKNPSESLLKLFSFCLILCFVFSLTPLAFPQDPTAVSDSIPPAPPSNVVVKDTPYDRGQSITINWEKSADDGMGANDVLGYEIMRSTEVDGEYKLIGTTTGGAQYFIDNDVKDKVSYFYKISVTDGINTSLSLPSLPAMSKAQWLNLRRTNIFIFAAALTFAILYYINRAKAGKELFIRKIAGLEAVDDAVGRATEMGRKIFYIPGISDMDNMQTIAGLTILGRVAKVAAEYEARLEVPVSRSMVMVSAREVMKEAYSNAGRPDAFNEDLVYYLTDDQFGYAAAVDGLFVREKPAAIFLQGQFYAESLILAETGNSVGAIQIAGTAAPAQIPFFIAACDFTLIGEELFAASAYLSKDPKLLGSLKGQDVGKVIFLAAILLGVILLSFKLMNIGPWFSVG
ncbi:MAG: fibronectin type III domain-containing protein [Candidatus Zixiibacteriota bacterium]